MGDVANAMINGLLCQFCGVQLDGDEPGYPRSCLGCDPVNGVDEVDDEPEDIEDMGWGPCHPEEPTDEPG